MPEESYLKKLEHTALRLYEELWSAGAGGASRLGRAMVYASRVAYITAEGFFNDLCLLRASALTFASLMGLVPILALGFAVLRGLGWRGDRLEELVLSKVTILSPDAISTIVSYIDNTNFAGLGVVGGSVLFLTFVSVLTNIEGSFNAIWGNVSPRPMARRIIDYFGLMVIGPALLAVTTSLNAALQSSAIVGYAANVWGLGPVMERVLGYTAQGVVWVLFAFLYVFVPNTRVRLVPALTGGVAAGSVWLFTQWAYIRFQLGMGNYNAIYGALAQLPLLMVWVYVSWVIVLLGAEVAFAVQNVGSYSRDRRIAAAGGGHATREYAGLRVAAELAAAAEGRRSVPDLSGLARDLDLPIRLVRDLVGDLAAAGIAHVTGEQDHECYLSLAPDRVPIAQVLDVFRGGVPAPQTGPGEPVDRRVRELLTTSGDARDEALGSLTLKDVARPGDRSGRLHPVDGPSSAQASET